MPRTRTSRYSQEYSTLLRMLSDARHKAGITQETLAVSMETSQSILSKIERGVVRMDLMDLFAYLDGIGVDPVEFMTQFRTRIGSGGQGPRAGP